MAFYMIYLTKIEESTAGTPNTPVTNGEQNEIMC